MEVGTLQGGQIAALQDGKEGSLGKPHPLGRVQQWGEDEGDVAVEKG